MKYDIKINQRAVIEQGLDLDFIDMAIFDCIACIFNCPEFPSITIPSEGNIFKWISTKKIIEELPLLKIGDKAIKLRIDKLVDCGLLIKYVWKEDGNKPYYAQGKLFSSMFRIDRNEYEGVGIKTTKGLEYERPRGWNMNDQGVGIKTTNYNNTNNNNNTNDNYTKNNEKSENEFSPEPSRTEKRRFSKENGLTPGNLNVRQSTIDKIDAAFEQLVFPIDDAEIKKLFFVLCCSPKWRGKTVHAMQMSLNKVQNYDKEFTKKLIEDSIAGGWQGLVFEDTDKKYQNYLRSRGSVSLGGITTFKPMSEEERKEAMEYLNM